MKLLKIIKNIEVPTGNIVIVRGEKGNLYLGVML